MQRRAPPEAPIEPLRFPRFLQSVWNDFPCNLQSLPMRQKGPPDGVITWVHADSGWLSQGCAARSVRESCKSVATNGGPLLQHCAHLAAVVTQTASALL